MMEDCFYRISISIYSDRAVKSYQASECHIVPSQFGNATLSEVRALVRSVCDEFKEQLLGEGAEIILSADTCRFYDARLNVDGLPFQVMKRERSVNASAEDALKGTIRCRLKAGLEWAKKQTAPF